MRDVASKILLTMLQNTLQNLVRGEELGAGAVQEISFGS